MVPKPPTANIRRQLQALEHRAQQEFQAEGWIGKIHFERSADLRYRGQGFELNVRFSPDLVADFHRAHQTRYGYSHPEREVELVTLRLRATTKAPRTKLGKFTKSESLPIKSEKRPVWFGRKAVDTAIYDRRNLRHGGKHHGPAIVTEYSATTVVRRG